ncbi:MAG: FAD-dependent oxidoreductase [Crocinitomix sp. MedPE-SWsnd]|nr:MAG: FAD-dependent oxidoreductase [Crocinitomix sp. MedPE-SWsnd]
MSKIVIIGNGISGVTAARHIRKNSDNEIVIISAESEHFFSRTALMYVFMGHMRFQDIKPYEDYFWEKNRIDLVFDYVNHIDTDSKILEMKGGSKITYDKLVLAVGSKPNKFGWPGQDLPGVQGLYTYQDLETIEENAKTAKHAVIVGGGLIGIELAEMMHSRGIETTFLVRESKFWRSVLPEEDGDLITRHIIDHKVDLRLNTELTEIIAGDDGRVKAVKTSEGDIVECQIVGLTAGVSPNVEFVKASKIEVDRGIKVNEFCETNIQDVYAIGDCAQFNESINGRRTIEQVWYTGRIMGETVAQTICGNKMPYNPGPWFNSAKFFDIEYQTYGLVLANREENENSFFWEHPKGKISVHVVWDKASGEFIGINTFGIRMRHDIFDKWLKEKVSVDVVMSELRSANFDPEFYRTYEKEIVDQFNSKTGRNVELKAKQWWRNLLAK